MTVQKMDGETVRAEWRKWMAEAGAGKTDVVVVVEGKETAAIISYNDYIALRDELIRLRADRKEPLEEMAINSALDYLAWQDRLAEEDDDDGSGGDGGDDDIGD